MGETDCVITPNDITFTQTSSQFEKRKTFLIRKRFKIKKKRNCVENEALFCVKGNQVNAAQLCTRDFTMANHQTV